MFVYGFLYWPLEGARWLFNSLSLMYNLGLISHPFQKDEDAVVYLEESLAINPCDIKARSLLRYNQHRQMNVVRVGAESKNTPQHQN